jgi:signal transduction histidine kinase
MTIVITPPFWKTWWFRTVVLVTIIGILWAAYQYRVAKLVQMERMRVRIASDLHDDIGSNLSSIALITEMVRQKIPEQPQEHSQLLEVIHAARHTADALKDIVWIIDPEHDKWDDIVLRMKDAAASLLKGIDYTFECDGTLPSTLKMEFRRNLLLIYKESLHNIVKYARATSVRLKIAQDDGFLHLSISDNGIGFDEATVAKGNGLVNLRKRSMQIDGSISVVSHPGQGTKIDLKVKIP